MKTVGIKKEHWFAQKCTILTKVLRWLPLHEMLYENPLLLYTFWNNDSFSSSGKGVYKVMLIYRNVLSFFTFENTVASEDLTSLFKRSQQLRSTQITWVKCFSVKMINPEIIRVRNVSINRLLCGCWWQRDLQVCGKRTKQNHVKKCPGFQLWRVSKDRMGNSRVYIQWP